MKKSKTISLVLITATLASCHKNASEGDWSSSTKSKTYVRGDSTAPYTRTHYNSGGSFLWFYAFRPLFGNNQGRFGRTGFYSNAISDRSNFGNNFSKSQSIVRGGFGRSSRAGG